MSENWIQYHIQTAGRPIEKTALRAVELLKGRKGLAVDLGCGAGVDSLYFLDNGFDVLAVDKNPEYFLEICETLPEELKSRLKIENQLFEELKLPTAILINASFALPFCHPEHFAKMWEEICGKLQPGGVFSGTFFGDHHSWAARFSDKHCFFSEQQVKMLMSNFELKMFETVDEEGEVKKTRDGKMINTHWHFFRVVAVKMR